MVLVSIADLQCTVTAEVAAQLCLLKSTACEQWAVTVARAIRRVALIGIELHEAYSQTLTMAKGLLCRL